MYFYSILTTVSIQKNKFKIWTKFNYERRYHKFLDYKSRKYSNAEHQYINGTEMSTPINHSNEEEFGCIVVKLNNSGQENCKLDNAIN